MDRPDRALAALDHEVDSRLLYGPGLSLVRPKHIQQALAYIEYLEGEIRRVTSQQDALQDRLTVADEDIKRLMQHVIQAEDAKARAQEAVVAMANAGYR